MADQTDGSERHGHTGPDTASELRSRISDLEAQLAVAERAHTVHKSAEADLRETLEYTESIVDTVREPLVVLDDTLRVIHASRSFYETFSVRRRDTVGQFIYDLGNKQWDVPALRTLLEQVLPRDTKVSDFEVTHDFPSLGRRVMLLNARRLWRPGNHTRRVLLAIEDVTERKRIEEELVRSNEDLQRFAYVAAHDLRSPLNAAMRMCQLLARRVKSTLAEDEFALLTESIHSLERLSALMQDILMYSEVSNAPQQRTLIELDEPVRTALANVQHHVSEVDAVVTVETMPRVLANRTHMVMVFQNLIGNALKYRRDIAPRITIHAAEEGKHWHLSIADNGEGFEPEFAESIFEPFKRLHGPNVPGSGIGLATCRRIIERFGGRLWAESKPGEGSTFHFTLPKG